MASSQFSYKLGDPMEKTVTIELRVRFKDEARFEIVRKATGQAARGLLAAANLIADSNHKPVIAVTAFDLFKGREAIDIVEVSNES